MKILGILLIGVGLALSLAAFVHDVRRLRRGREHGWQFAGSRIAPEVHTLAAVLTGTGVGLIWGWKLGCGAGVAHVALAYFVVRPVIDR